MVGGADDDDYEPSRYDGEEAEDLRDADLGEPEGEEVDPVEKMTVMILMSMMKKMVDHVWRKEER